MTPRQQRMKAVCPRQTSPPHWINCLWNEFRNVPTITYYTHDFEKTIYSRLKVKIILLKELFVMVLCLGLWLLTGEALSGSEGRHAATAPAPPIALQTLHSAVTLSAVHLSVCSTVPLTHLQSFSAAGASEAS